MILRKHFILILGLLCFGSLGAEECNCLDVVRYLQGQSIYELNFLLDNGRKGDDVVYWKGQYDAYNDIIRALE
jgi:hypothetical protein